MHFRRRSSPRSHPPARSTYRTGRREDVVTACDQASDAEMIIKPRMRCQDADISILQVCLRCRRKWARRYHSGVTGGSRPFPALSRPSISANLVPAWLAEKTEDSRHDLRDRPPALALQAQGSKATCTRSATPAVWTIGWHPNSGRAANAHPRPVGSGTGAGVCR